MLRNTGVWCVNPSTGLDTADSACHYLTGSIRQLMVTRMTEPQKRNRHPDYKTAFRVKSWREYEQSLRARGDITLWFSQDAIDAWRAPMTGRRWVQPVCADIAIETELALRQTEGFLGSVLRMMGAGSAEPKNMNTEELLCQIHRMKQLQTK